MQALYRRHLSLPIAVGALCVALFTCNFLCAQAQVTAKKLNVLFLMSDDMRPDLGCYGNSIVSSPNIDALAKVGLRFDRAYCQYPLCNPSRSSMLTGRHPTETGVLNNTAYFRTEHPNWITLPQHFRNNGYASLRTGKIFHGGIDDGTSWTEGADDPSKQGGKNPAKKPTTAERMKTSDRIIVLDGEGQSHGDYTTANRAIAYLEKYRDKPFFLACGFTKPHSPPSAPQRFFDQLDINQIKLPVNFAPSLTPGEGIPAASLTRNGDLFIDRNASEDEARKVIQAYWASLSFTDWNLGRVIKKLDELGLRDDTVIVFWGDHGYHLGERGKWAKHNSLFEVGSRVPLIISLPRQATQGLAANVPVQSLDIYPTLCELCGLPIPDGLSGHSLAPLLADPTSHWEHPAYTVTSTAGGIGVAVRTERYRYAHWNDGSAGAMLFDEINDPHELKNLIDDPSVSAIREELAAKARKLKS